LLATCVVGAAGGWHNGLLANIGLQYAWPV